MLMLFWSQRPVFNLGLKPFCAAQCLHTKRALRESNRLTEAEISLVILECNDILIINLYQSQFECKWAQLISIDLGVGLHLSINYHQA
jgi:hypothetical protein